MNITSSHRASMAILFAVAFLLVKPAIGLAAGLNPNQGINKGLMRTLSAEWWQWALSIPASVNPLSFNDPMGSSDYCGVGQHGDVWFLGGRFDGSGSLATRACTIPAGTSIFFPIINAECSTIEGSGMTEEELRTCAIDLIDHVTEVEASVDGVLLKGLNKSRVQSRLFSFSLPPGDMLGLFGNSPNPSPSVSDGFWVLLPPLAEGEHEIKFRGVAPFPEFGFTFEQNVSYTITIVAQ